MNEGTKVVMTEQMIGMCFGDDYDLEPRFGMIFVYRGINSVDCHEFIPDFSQGHNIGFQLPDEDFKSKTFRKQFLPVTGWETE